MTQEDKELLLKDFCARLPYGVMAQVYGWDDDEEIDVIVPIRVYSVNTDGYVYFGANEYNVDYYPVEDCTPYLRPMSSMTKEEYRELEGLLQKHNFSLNEETSSIEIDWLNKNMFDYRGLIEKGLAISTEEYNPYEKV